jgi:hypothetical protein
MEKLSDYTILISHVNRQVIMNKYLDEDYLDERHGFHFRTVAVTESSIVFSRKGNSEFHIPIEKSTRFYVNDDFQNYYILRDGSIRLEIYFP